MKGLFGGLAEIANLIGGMFLTLLIGKRLAFSQKKEGLWIRVGLFVIIQFISVGFVAAEYFHMNDSGFGLSAFISSIILFSSFLKYVVLKED